LLTQRDALVKALKEIAWWDDFLDAGAAQIMQQKARDVLRILENQS
jgi:hypothetical protein